MTLTLTSPEATLRQRKQAAVLGAFVADAASLGFHWLYDPERIAQLAPEEPEFRPPSEADYRDASGYFAADGKKVGDLSHYGAQLQVALRSLHERGSWDAFHYQSVFCQTFDRGGSFTGYIDGATQGTLDNVATANRKLIDASLAQVEGLEEKQRGFFRKYVLKKGELLRGDELVEAIVGMTQLVYKEPAMAERARTITRYFDRHRQADHGADDNQLPAAAKLPVVVSCFAGQPEMISRAEEAIRVTNNNSVAVAYGLFAARVLEKVLLGQTIRDALNWSLKESDLDETAHQRLAEAIERDTSDLAALGRHFGPACPMQSAIPVATALLKEEPDFVTGIRRNIWVSGDNAGRSIWLGAVLAAANGVGGAGVPWSWVARLNSLPELLPQLESVT